MSAPRGGGSSRPRSAGPRRLQYSPNSREGQLVAVGEQSPLEHDIASGLARQVHKLAAPECPSLAKIRLIHSLYRLLAFGEHQEEFIWARGIEALVTLAVTDFPKDGRFLHTKVMSDQLVDLFGGRASHSVRRVAVGMLADLSAYRAYQEEIVACGLHQALPDLLEPLVRKYRHGQTYAEMYGRGRAARHGQYFCSRLVVICANLVQLPDAGPSIIASCGELLISHFDPFSRLVGPDPGELRPPDIEEFIEGPADEDPLDLSYLGGGDPFPEDWTRFVYNAIPHATEGELMRMVGWGVTGKARAQRLALDPTPGHLERLACLDVLEPAHERYCRKRTERIRSEDEARGKKAAEVRLRGNQAFNEGQVEDARAAYTEALRLCATDAAAYSNRALCCLYRGRLEDALEDARRAVRLDPHKARCWARAGEVLLKLRQGDCALVCFRQAAHLAPLAEEYGVRVGEAMQLLAGCRAGEVGQVESLPRLSLQNTRTWLRGLIARREEGGLPTGSWPLRARKGRAGRRRGGGKCGEPDPGSAEAPLKAVGLEADEVDAAVAELLQLAWAQEVASQMPLVEGERWEITFTDTARTTSTTAGGGSGGGRNGGGAGTEKGGQVVFVVRVVEAASGRALATYETYGAPKAPAVALAALRAVAYPQDPTQRLRPGRVVVAHRLAPYYQELSDALGRVAVTTCLETREEAVARAHEARDDPDGINHPSMHAGLAQACSQCGARGGAGGSSRGASGRGGKENGGGGKKGKGGALAKCPRCMTLFYCSERCRKEHWNEGHRWSCSLVPALNKAYAASCVGTAAAQ